MARHEITDGKVYDNGYAQFIINKMNGDGTVNVTIKNKKGVNYIRNYTEAETEGLLIGSGLLS